MSTTADDVFWFCPQRRVLFCLRCSSGINPTQRGRHLLHHHSDLGVERRKELEQTMDCEGAILPTEKERQVEAGLKWGRVPCLPVHQGVKCSAQGCLWVMGGDTKFKAHVKEKHASDEPAPTAVRTAMQHMFPNPVVYFAVDEGLVLEGLKDRKEDALEQLVSTYQHERQLAAQVVPTNVDDRHMTKWDRKTGWAKFHEGRLIGKIASLAALARLEDPPIVKSVMDSVDRVLRQIYAKFHELGGHARQIFQSIDDNLSEKPMDTIDRESLAKYIKVWQKLVGFLLRLVIQDEDVGLELSSELREMLRTLSTSEGGLEMDDVMLDLSVALINYKVTRCVFLSPIGYWLSVDGYHAADKRWKTAVEARRTLSGLVYCIRLWSMAGWERLDPTLETTSAARYCKQYIHKDSHTVFNYVQQLRNYAKAAEGDWYGNPVITWAEDSTSLQFKGDELSLQTMKDGLMSLVDDLEDGLLSGLIFRDEGFLEECSPERFRDILTWSGRGDCFLNLQDGGIAPEDRWKTVLEAAEQHTLGKVIVEEMRTAATGERNVWSARKAWVERATGRLRQLLMVIHLTGGLTARMKELLSIRWANDWTGHRSIMVIQDLVAIVSTYNKVDALKHTPTVIARFLPLRVSRIVVAWISAVIPFWAAIEATMDKEDQVPFSTFVFQNKGEVWSSTDMTNVLKSESKARMGIELHGQGWRQVMIAIDKRFMRNGDITGVDAHILQSGHGEEVEEHHYALQANSLVGLSSETIDAFRKVSKRWHRFWGFDIEDPTVTTRSSTEYLTTPQPNSTNDLALVKSAMREVLSEFDVLPLQKKICSEGSTPKEKEQIFICKEPSVTVAVRRKLEEMYGTSNFRTAAQQEVVEAVSSTSQNIVWVAPTGAGKTLAYTIPASLSRGKITLVFVPYTALREQARSDCESLGLSAASLTANDLPETSVVFAVPEMATMDHFRTWIMMIVGRGRLQRVVFDECHHLVMDTVWRPAWGMVADLFSESGCLKGVKVQKVFLSATLPKPRRTMLYEAVGIEPSEAKEVVERTVRTNLRHIVQVLPGGCSYEAAVDEIWREAGPAAKILVYVMSKELGRELADVLRLPFFHGELGPTEKDELVVAFQSKERGMMLATTAAGEGVDLGVTQVIHLGGAFELEDYCQQAGRAGRKGELADSIIIISQGDRRRLEQGAKPAARRVWELVRTKECRRRILSAYMDGELRWCEEGEALCDNCGNHGRTQDIELPEQVVKKPVLRTDAPDGLDWAFQQSSTPMGSAPSIATGVSRLSKRGYASLNFDALSSNMVRHSPLSLSTVSQREPEVYRSSPGNMDFTTSSLSYRDSITTSPCPSRIPETPKFVSAKVLIESGSTKGFKRRRLEEERLMSIEEGRKRGNIDVLSTDLTMTDELVILFGQSKILRCFQNPETADAMKVWVEAQPFETLKDAAWFIRDMTVQGETQRDINCLWCWLSGDVERACHQWGNCDRCKSAIIKDDKTTMRKGIKMQPGVCWRCYLPNKLHKRFGHCEWDDVLKDIVIIGSKIERLHDIFRVYGVVGCTNPTRLGLFLSQTGPTVSKAFDCKIQEVFLHIVAWVRLDWKLRMESR